jgi:hypothetical protein
MNENFGLISISAIIALLVLAMAFKSAVLDFVKANIGLIILLTLFSLLLAVAFHVFHENANPAGKDFLAWLEQKAGEVLASVMTVIVGARAANGRSGDGNGNGNGKTPPIPAPAEHP